LDGSTPVASQTFNFNSDFTNLKSVSVTEGADNTQRFQMDKFIFRLADPIPTQSHLVDFNSLSLGSLGASATIDGTEFRTYNSLDVIQNAGSPALTNADKIFTINTPGNTLFTPTTLDFSALGGGSANINFLAQLPNGLTVSDTFNVSSLSQTYTFPGTFADITSLQLTSGGDFAIDNLAYTTPVPEPGTLALLLGAGAAGLGIWSRRRVA
jgi:hypothetical protein